MEKFKDVNFDIFQYANKNKEDILKEFNSDLKLGLSEQEAKQRLIKHGLNEFSLKRNRWWHIFLRQFNSPFIYLLFGAIILAFLLGEKLDAIMIFAFVVINTFLGFLQEFKSEKTLELLNQYSVSSSRVLRDGKELIVKSTELVPGDIIYLSLGDQVPADVRFLDSHDLTIDESILTGESVAIRKNSELIENKIKDLYNASNIGFSGTSLVNGKTTAIILTTGKKTRMGNIASLAVSTRHISDFEKGISNFSKFILKMVVITLIFVFLANVLIKGRGANIIELIIFSIALAVSVIPEALPVVMTFSLSKGALKLAKKKVVVRRLSAIEDLGGVEVICSDKTGTLTENKLTVYDFYGVRKEEILIYGNLATSSPQEQKLEPFDIALYNKLDLEKKEALKKYNRISDVPFDPNRKINSVLIEKNKKYELIVRGAPEVIFKLSNLKETEVKKANDWIAKEGVLGHRVIALAKKNITYFKDIDLEDYEKDLEFLGIISFVDPIKSSTEEAIKEAASLGVQIKIITGDNKEVSGAVAYKIGLIKDPKNVLSGEEFEKMDDEEKIKAILKYNVFCRISPEQKYKIIELLQSKHRVGFLGEGINDAPALKIAGVSIVVQSASDISRENADIVLLKKNLKVIIDGIKEGREIFANTTKYIKTTLASNFGNFYAVAISSLFIPFLPMLPLQILLLNLLSDFPMIAIATDSVDKDELKTPKSYNVKDITLFCIILGIVSTLSDFIVFGFFFHYPQAVLQTNWFIASIFTEIVFIFSIRTHKPFFKASTPSIPVIILAFIACFLTVFIPFTAIGHNLFRFVSPSINHLMIIFGIVIFEFITSEIAKLAYYKYLYKNNKKIYA